MRSDGNWGCRCTQGMATRSAVARIGRRPLADPVFLHVGKAVHAKLLYKAVACAFSLGPIFPLPRVSKILSCSLPSQTKHYPIMPVIFKNLFTMPSKSRASSESDATLVAKAAEPAPRPYFSGIGGAGNYCTFWLPQWLFHASQWFTDW